jgi:hypothetical protein
MKNIFYLLIGLFLITSCGKDEVESSKPVLANCTFLKLREGSEYKYDLFKKGVTSAKTLITNKLTTIDGKEYVELSATLNGVASKQYLNCNGGIFTTGGNFKQKTAAGSELKLFSLDFNLEDVIGQITDLGSATTTDDDGTFSLESDYEGRVLERGLTKTVSGKKYSNVTEYEIIVVSVLDGFLEFDTVHTIFYLAPEVGMILSETRLEGSSVVESSETLTKYTY